jgi:hypothetical protein
MAERVHNSNMNTMVEVDNKRFRYYGGKLKVMNGRFFVPLHIALKYRLTSDSSRSIINLVG